jgi:hypothetical protein
MAGGRPGGGEFSLGRERKRVEKRSKKNFKGFIIMSIKHNNIRATTFIVKTIVKF